MSGMNQNFNMPRPVNGPQYNNQRPMNGNMNGNMNNGPRPNGQPMNNNGMRPNNSPMNGPMNNQRPNNVQFNQNMQRPNMNNGYVVNNGPRSGQAPNVQVTSKVTTTTTQQVRQKKTQISVELYKGNYVVNCPVSKNVIKNGVYDGKSEEFGYCRYTAATCKDPDTFMEDNFTLRQKIWNRRTELFIVLTMYNEDEVLFARSMTSVMKNIGYMCRENKHKWSKQGWQNIVVCIVSDGRKKINSKVLDSLEVMGVYQKDVMKNQVNGKDVSAHIFEYTVQTCFDENMNLCGPDKGYTPVQVIFCLKEKNQKKINSHRWFFNAFGRILKPEVCVLIDVGTKPTHDSIYQLWKAFDSDPNVGGACGEIYCQLGKNCKNLVSPLVAAQNFEYKISNILDKPLESVFGYISVLPGAFSAYRYKALQNYDTAEGKKGPLYAYFKGEKLHEGCNMFKSNMYLAEDRILCFELVAKKNCKWILKYVKAAKAETDVPDNIPEFISQRRRWLNGSFFAAVYASYNWSKIYQTNHSSLRKLALTFEYIYNLVNLVFSWFNIANFYLCFHFLTDKASGPDGIFGKYGSFIKEVLELCYIFAMLCVLVCSLGNRPQGSKKLYLSCIILFAIIMVFMFAMAFYTVYRSIVDDQGKSFAQRITKPTFRNIVISLLSTYGLYLIGSLLHGQPWHMITSFFQYLLMLPSYVNILMTYAFCNTHDVSWGTKGDNTIAPTSGAVKINPGEKISIELPTQSSLDERYEKLIVDIKRKEKVVKQKRDETTKQEDDKKNFRTNLVLIWLTCNLGLIIFMTKFFNIDFVNKVFGNDKRDFIHRLIGANRDDFNENPIYLTFIFWSVAILSFIRFVGSTYYLIDNMLN
jgi:chitin synthase